MRASLDTADDADLLARSRRGDAEAYAAFYRRHERLVLGWLIGRTRDPVVAADLAAEVFAAAYLAADRFRPEAAPAAAWLLGIARNKLHDSLRVPGACDQGRAGAAGVAGPGVSRMIGIVRPLLAARSR